MALLLQKPFPRDALTSDYSEQTLNGLMEFYTNIIYKKLNKFLQKISVG